MALSKIKANSLGTTGTASSTTYLRGDMAWTAIAGDIEGVTAGNGLSGGGTSGTVALAINTAITADLSTAQALSNKTITASSFSGTQVDITAEGDLRLQDAAGGQYAAIQAPTTIATSYTLTLPTDDGTNEQFLQTNGSGVLTWAAAGGATGGGTDTIYYENGQTVNSSYSLTASNTAVSAGPVTVACGVTVTDPAGAAWVVV